jgi:hypothetical protein
MAKMIEVKACKTCPMAARITGGVACTGIKGALGSAWCPDDGIPSWCPLSDAPVVVNAGDTIGPGTTALPGNAPPNRPIPLDWSAPAVDSQSLRDYLNQNPYRGPDLSKPQGYAEYLNRNPIIGSKLARVTIRHKDGGSTEIEIGTDLIPRVTVKQGGSE